MWGEILMAQLYDVILLDLDDTLYDFSGSTRLSLGELFDDMGLPEAALEAFFVLNNQLWTQFEHGQIAKSLIYAERFRLLFAQFGRYDDPVLANDRYREGLLRHMRLLPDAEALLQRLVPKCRLFAVTNGETKLQKQRMALSGLAGYFLDCFISEEMDSKKPELAFFDQVFAKIGRELRSRAIILGDSLSSDMQGGRNAGIATCLYGPLEKADGRCDYVAPKLLDFPDIIGV